MAAKNIISVEQLQIGVYVYLDVGWMHHPFSFNNFKIRSEEQLQTIRQLGLQQVRWDPERSDHKPLPKGAAAPPLAAQPAVPPAAPAATPTATPAAAPAASATEAAATPAATVEETPEQAALKASIIAAKQARIERLAEHREQIARVEQAFLSAAAVVKKINQTIFSMPEQTLAEAGALVGEMVDALLAAPDLAIQVMSEKPGAEETYFHSLNVSVLSMILARELHLPAEVVRVVGIGALFHDIGLAEIPPRIVHNPGNLTKAERDFRKLHCQYGADIGRKAGLPSAALQIINQHHERYDGSGYPRQLKGDTIDPLARIVALANTYDKLCNPANIAQALTPHEALALMFGQQRQRHDPKLLQIFIRFMGVYPAGTVVSLSNEAMGLVIAVNAARPLKPTVVVYDPEVPKHEAIVLDLEEEPDINITKAIRPGQLLPAVFDYLSPRRRVSYYFDPGSGPNAEG
ncbi:MAG TPA: HD domain-containing phosphohydrolase [Rhodocyclaceae bacterium]